MFSRFLVFVLVGFLGVGSAVAQTNAIKVKVTPIPSPAKPGAMGSSLVSDDGRHWLSWLEPVGDEAYAFKVARYDEGASAWIDISTVASGSNWVANWADFPVLAAQGDRLTAVWLVENPATGPKQGHHGAGYHAEFSVSQDGGKSWAKPEPLSRETEVVEFVALQPLRDGRLLAAWLDGRLRRSGQQDQQALYSRVIGSDGPDLLVDRKVCDCCQLSLVTSPAGGALLAYRGRTDDEIRDIQVAEFGPDGWQQPGNIHQDGWKIAGCPVNGPQLAANERTVVGVWHTSASGSGRVQLARRGNDQKEFSQPVQVDLGAPLGRVDTVVLADGTALVTWVEAKRQDRASGILLRVVGSDNSLSAPVVLAPSSESRASGFPRVAVLSGAMPAKLLLTYTRDAESTDVLTSLVSLEAAPAR